MEERQGRRLRRAGPVAGWGCSAWAALFFGERDDFPWRAGRSPPKTPPCARHPPPTPPAREGLCASAAPTPAVVRDPAPAERQLPELRAPPPEGGQRQLVRIEELAALGELEPASRKEEQHRERPRLFPQASTGFASAHISKRAATQFRPPEAAEKRGLGVPSVKRRPLFAPQTISDGYRRSGENPASGRDPQPPPPKQPPPEAQRCPATAHRPNPPGSASR